jgi:hypothetical protein
VGDACEGPEVISTPNILSGPAQGVPDYQYRYYTGGSHSTYGHSIQFLFDWGDGTNSGWLPVGTTKADKSWASTQIYPIKAQARCVTDTLIISGWSTPFMVTISDGPDPVGSWTNPPQQSCKNTSKGPKCTINGILTLNNIGDRDAKSFRIHFYLSDDDTYDEGDTFLKRKSIGKIRAKTSKNIKFVWNLPLGQTASGKYVIAVIDALNSVTEVDETNNVIIYGPIL